MRVNILQASLAASLTPCALGLKASTEHTLGVYVRLASTVMKHPLAPALELRMP